MAVNITANAEDVTYGVNSYVADTKSDLADLPKNCAPGSTCLVIEDSSIYMKNSLNQ